MIDDAHRAALETLAVSESEAIELYTRRTLRVRVESRSDSAPDIANIDDVGSAARVELGDGTRGFAAASGNAAATLHSIVEVARATAKAVEPGRARVRGGEASCSRDLDPDAPGPCMLEADVSARWVRSTEASLRDRGVEVVRVALERAWTGEWWTTTRGLSSRRTRVRSRAEVAVRTPGGAVFATPLVACGHDRTPDATPVLGAIEALESGRDDRSRSLDARRALWAPEAAAVLVRAVVERRFAEADPRPRAVGPGWVVREEPAGPEHAVGGRFDDAGRAVERVEHADGRSFRPASPAGTVWRASFRDPPERGPGRLVVAPASAERTASSAIPGVRLHPLAADRWIVEPVGSAAPFEVDPRRVAAACVGGVGEAQETAAGVRTPALVFEFSAS